MAEVIQIDQQYYVLATSVVSGASKRVLKQGDTFGVFDRHGDVRTFGKTEQGVYHEGTRFVSRMELLVNGKRPLLLSSNIQENDLLFTVDSTNPDFFDGDERTLASGDLHVARSKFLHDAVCHEIIRFTNFGESEAAFTAELIFDADFVDVFEVRGMRRKQRGKLIEPRREGRAIVIGYEGLDGIRRETRFEVSPEPETLDGSELKYAFRLGRREQAQISVQAVCVLNEKRSEVLDTNTAYESVCKEARSLEQSCCALRTSSELFNTFLKRATADLRMLATGMDDAHYPYAGIPWYSTPFGRDGIITAMESLWINPDSARGVLSFLSKTQAESYNESQDAEPGKILHESRKSEMANTGEIPFGQYYGTIDATPLYLMLAGQFLRRTGDVAFIAKLWPHFERALNWIDKYGDQDGDGFVEYLVKAHKGLRNQGWKDSEDSIFHADGRLAEGSIALCEVQAYVYGAKNEMAYMAEMLGRRADAMRLKAEAVDLRKRFEETFWDEELSTYVLALDGEKQPCRVKSSNAGHCLFAGIASEERARRLEQVILSKEMHSGWGVRTIASDQSRYNPMSYHNGSIWPHDNALIAYGLSLYGLKEGAKRILEDLFQASMFMDQQRLPELYCGFHRRSGEGPTLYPVACSPQAWASGAIPYLLQACLGLSIDAIAKTVTFNQPTLPDSLDWLRIRGMRVGTAELDILLSKYEGDVGAHLERREGEVTLRIVK